MAPLKTLDEFLIRHVRGSTKVETKTMGEEEQVGPFLESLQSS